jgi:hypothetical protein
MVMSVFWVVLAIVVISSSVLICYSSVFDTGDKITAALIGGMASLLIILSHPVMLVLVTAGLVALGCALYLVHLVFRWLGKGLDWFDAPGREHHAAKQKARWALNAAKDKIYFETYNDR